MSGDITAAARVGSISSMSESPLFRGVVTESLSAGALHWQRMKSLRRFYRKQSNDPAGFNPHEQY